MAEQILGEYSFEDDPEKMGIPESKKTVATVNTYSSAALFQWPAQIIGEKLVLEWTLMSDTMYEQLREFYLAGDVLTWQPRFATEDVEGATYEVVVIDLSGVYNEATFHHQPYRFDVKLTLFILSETVVPKVEKET